VGIQTCRSLPLRNDLLPGFDDAVVVFEAWMPLLLLRAMQALGFFMAPGAACTRADLAAVVVPAYSRFSEEMLAMLQRAGVPLSVSDESCAHVFVAIDVHHVCWGVCDNINRYPSAVNFTECNDGQQACSQS